jgi:hypothetical protein
MDHTARDLSFAQSFAPKSCLRLDTDHHVLKAAICRLWGKKRPTLLPTMVPGGLEVSLRFPQAPCGDPRRIAQVGVAGPPRQKRVFLMRGASRGASGNEPIGSAPSPGAALQDP